jgi:uncharacterized protein
VQIVIAGSSGFLGTALRRVLAERGHSVTRLVRRAPAAPDESRWDPYADQVDQAVIDAADVVINLAGAPTIGNPHSRRWAHNLRTSRLTTTDVLARAVTRGGGHAAYLAGNGISFYGDHGDEVLPEDATSHGGSLLTTLSRDWEAATGPASAAGARVCVLRTSPVIDRANAPLKQMLPVFKLGLGTRIGNGRQYFPVISMRDWLGGVTHLLTSDASGPFNLCCPVTPTNREFTDALASAVGRKARLAVPAKVVDIAAGRMAPEALGSMNTVPAALEAAGYVFQDRDVRDVIAAALRPSPRSSEI